MKSLHKMIVVSLVALLSACAEKDMSELEKSIETVKRKPAGEIDPLPASRPYKAFSYGAMSVRSPFTIPVKVINPIQLSGKKVSPIEGRPKEPLESFSISSLTMVGSLMQNGVQWALILDDKGNVTPVKKGNYLGRNHGQIVETTESYIEYREIVADGAESWIERPRVMKLREQD